MPKPKYWTYFSFVGEEPWLAVTDDRELGKAIERAEKYLKRGHRPDGDFIDQAFIYQAEYDDEYEDWSPVGEPVWEAGEPFGPIGSEEAADYLSFWIDPYGEIYGVPRYGHIRVTAMLIRAGILPDVEESILGSLPILNGWLQVTTEPGRQTLFDFVGEPTQKQMDALFDIVVTHRSIDSKSSRCFVEDSMKWLSHPKVTRKNPKRPGFLKRLLS